MRWLTRDPIEEDGGINLYAYCSNNALKNIDILGRDVEDDVAKAIIEYAKFVVEARKFWKNVANGYFRARGMVFSAQLLEHSLQSMPASLHFTQNDALTVAIRNAKSYNDFIDGIITRQTGKVARYESSQKMGVRLNDYDLALAIDHATISLDGEICKSKNGKAKVSVEVLIEDDYDFHWHNISSTERRFVTIGNNAAYISQLGQILTPYHIDIRFKEEGVRDVKTLH